MSTSDPEVNTCDDIRQRVAKAPTEVRERQYLIKKAIDLGCMEHIPDHWEVEIHGRAD